MFRVEPEHVVVLCQRTRKDVRSFESPCPALLLMTRSADVALRPPFLWPSRSDLIGTVHSDAYEASN